MSVLQCSGVSKAYQKNQPVLSNLNLELPAGRVVGLLGPNGCGKSTLIKLIAGVLRMNAGSITVDGIPVGEKSKAVVSYLPDRPYFSTNMRVREMVKFFSDFYEDFDRDCAFRLLQDLHVDPEKMMKSLSKGNREKVQLILVMSRRAKLYLLDEPIAGVDPAARDYILETIVKNRNPEATVVVTTHLIYDVAPILDDFIFLDFGGVILRSGSVQEVTNYTGKTLDELFKEDFRCSNPY